MQLRNCTFCGTQIEPGTGMMYIRRDGAYIYFCSRKCRVNMINLKRVPRRTKWTKEYHTIKAMRKDSIKPPVEEAPTESAPEPIQDTPVNSE